MSRTKTRSRKRSRKRSSLGPQYAPTLTLADDGIHLFGFIAGLITTLLAVMLCVSSWQTPQKTKEALKAVAKTGDVEQVVDMNDTDFDNVLKSGTIKELADLLDMLNKSIQAKADVPRQVQVNRRRISLGNTLLTKPLDEDVRSLAAISKINALSESYGLDLIHDLKGPNVAETLRSAANEFCKDDNEEISKPARIAMLKHDMFELAFGNKRIDLHTVSNQMTELLHDYPKDTTMESQIVLLVRFLHKRVADDGVRLMDMVQSASAKFDSPKVMQLVSVFADEGKIKKVGFDSFYDNRWIHGQIGESQIVKAAIELLNDPDSKNLVIEEVGKAANWFEQEGKHVQAQQIYEAMESAADTLASAEIAAMARKWAIDGFQRLKLVKQTLQVSGRLLNGEPLEPALFERRGMIIAFWSTQDADSIQALSQVGSATSTWRKKGGVVLAVNVDDDPQAMLRLVAQKYPKLRFAGHDSVILTQCPTSTLPRVILVSRRGVVLDINVPIEDLQTETEFLLLSQQ